jgi:hypothetical protein
MASLPRHEKLGRNRYFSVSHKLRNEGKSSEEFEAILSTLTLEDLIALRLELAGRLTRGKIHGLLQWKSLPDVIKDAAIKAALSISSTRKDATRILGISERNFKKAVKKYDSIDFFVDETDH